MKNKNICPLGKLILARLGEMGKTQEWLAKNAQIFSSALSVYISGKKRPSALTIGKLSKALGIESEKIVEAMTKE